MAVKKSKRESEAPKSVSDPAMRRPYDDEVRDPFEDDDSLRDPWGDPEVLEEGHE